MQIRRVSILGVMVVAVSLIFVNGASAQESTGPQPPGGQASPPPAVPQPAPEPNATGTPTAPTNGNGTGHIKLEMNFQDAPLEAVLNYLSEKAGLIITASGVSLDGRITVISRQPITVDEAVALINSVLTAKQLAVVRTGKTLRITTVNQAKTENMGVLHVTDPSQVPDGAQIMTFVIPVKYVDAQALSQNLMSLLPEYATLEANRDGNALILTDSSENVRRVMKIIQALDTHMATVAEIKVWRLTNAQASGTAQLVNSIFQQEAQAARSANRGNMGGMMSMMMGGRGGRGGDMGGMGGASNNTTTSSATRGNAAVVAAADDRTNSVVVRGPTEVLTIIDGMIEQLDKKTTEIAAVRVFQLRYADALNAAQVINQLFGQTGSTSSSRGNQQGMGPGGFMMMGGGRGGRGGMGGQQSSSTSSSLQVTAAADSRTNTVVVTGPEVVLEVVGNVIKGLDQQIPNVADVKTFHLQYADASNTATLINDVFGTSRSTSSRSSSRNSSQNTQIQFGGAGGGRGGMGGMAGGMGQSGTGSSSSDVTVVASADTRTNSVVVSGPPETLTIIADVIKELDQNPEQERRIFVYPLKNATASNLMTVLNSLFTQMRSLNQQGTRTTQSNQGAATGRGGAAGGTGGMGGGTTASTSSSSSEASGANDLSDETYFQADTTTNSLLVLTSTKNYQLVKPIIDDLDKSVGQVLIKVLFAEITHTDSIDLGVDFSGLNLHSETSVFGTAANPVPQGTQASTTFGTPDSGLGLTLNTVEGDWDITLRALQAQTRVNVLSRPYVLARNNQAATITVAAEVPIPNGTASNANGATTTIEYRNDIGIVLTVTPQVNPDGLVNLTVSPKITNRTGRVQVSETLSAETFSTRSATTMVTVKDGQTVVIGGLIEDKINDTINKIPLLGDIPIVGALFGRTVHDKSKTELLIFLSPRVAQEAAKLTDISNDERMGTNLNSDATISPLFRQHMANMDMKNEPNQPTTTAQTDAQP